MYEVLYEFNIYVNLTFSNFHTIVFLLTFTFNSGILSKSVLFIFKF